MKLINQEYESLDKKVRFIDVLKNENIGIASFNFLRSLLLLKDLTPNSRITIRELLYLEDFSESDAYEKIMSKQSEINSIQKQINELQMEIEDIKREHVQIVDSITIDESYMPSASTFEKELVYAKCYRQELEKYAQRKVSKFCKFPLSESYTEEAWHNMLVWKKFSLHRLTYSDYERGFVKVAHYYAVFDYALDSEDKENFLSELKGNYDYSEQNDSRMNNWIFFHNLRNCKAVPVRQSHEYGCYSDDEDGVMSALAHGDGDFFGL